MALTKISSNEIQPAAITSDLISADVSLGVKISNVSIANSSYTILDDTAVDTAGGYIVITGAGFNSGAQVIIGGTNATSVTRVSSTELRAQVPAKSAATYNVYVVNTDGSTGIRVNGLTYSSLPTWVTGSTLDPQQVDVAFNLNFDATSAVSYANTSAIPAGTTLLANGYFYGTVTGITEETTYSFTVQATDAENQDSPRTFSVTVTVVVADEYFNSTVLLLNGDGTNGAQNQTFVDSSTNALTITRQSNATQGSFSPFSPTGWSNYFDGTGDYLTSPSSSNLTLGTGDFSISFWFFATVSATSTTAIFGIDQSATTGSFVIFSKYPTAGDNTLLINAYGGNSVATSQAFNINQWNHVAMSRSSGTLSVYLNGTRVANAAFGDNLTGTYAVLGRSYYSANQEHFTGYISDLRVVKGTALYSGTSISVPTEPSTAVSNTQLLTCQSNRFVDKSTNNFTITRNGDTKVVSFSPFAPTTAYSTSTHGGSMFMDGASDALTLTSTTGGLGSGDFTLEFWWYPETTSAGDGIIFNSRTGGGSDGIDIYGLIKATTASIVLFDNSSKVNYFAWNHVAFTRSGSTFYRFINGEADGSRSFTNNLSGVGFTIGNGPIGKIAGFKHVRGTALYTSAFSIPTQPPTATSGTELLLNFTNAGIYDATAKNVLETVGNAQVSTAVKKYGTGSIYIPAYTDACKLPGVSLLGDFTIEGWFKPSISGDEKFFILQGINATNGFILATSTTEIRWRSNGTTDISYTISDSNWYHVAIVRSGTSSNNLKMYYNGNQVTQGTYTNQILSSVGSLYVGIGNQLGSQFSSYGYIDDLRITNGVARYTSNFTPPTAALPIQ